MAARFARRQRGEGGSEALGRGVGGVVPPPTPLLAMPAYKQATGITKINNMVSWPRDMYSNWKFYFKLIRPLFSKIIVNIA